jgi:hypothetical protein
MSVTIGGTSVTPTHITTTSFQFTTPAEPVGYVEVQVTTAAGASMLTPADGYIYTGLASYVPVTPFPILDTRSGTCIQCGSGALGPGATRTLQITGVGGLPSGTDPVPSSTTAVVLNVTAVGGTGSSYLTVDPNGTGRRLASGLNFPSGLTIANLVTVALGQSSPTDTEREVNIFNHVGTVNVVVEVAGYFTATPTTPNAGTFQAIPPLRICDSRGGELVSDEQRLQQRFPQRPAPRHRGLHQGERDRSSPRRRLHDSLRPRRWRGGGGPEPDRRDRYPEHPPQRLPDQLQRQLQLSGPPTSAGRPPPTSTPRPALWSPTWWWWSWQRPAAPVVSTSTTTSA